MSVTDVGAVLPNERARMGLIRPTRAAGAHLEAVPQLEPAQTYPGPR